MCPYWLDTLNNDLDGNQREDIYFQVCANPDGTSDALGGAPGLPFSKGTVFDDVVVGPTPDGAQLLEFEAMPLVDWDVFFCEWLPGDVAGEELRIGIEPIGEECDNQLGNHHPIPVGCAERNAFEAVAGRRYIVRAYNWSDPFPLEARYRFRD